MTQSTYYSPTAKAKLNEWGLSDEDVSTEARTTRMLSQGSPLLTAAGNQARQDYNARGLLNTSMAEAGALDTMAAHATGIADADANRIVGVARTDRDNQAAAGRLGAELASREAMTKAGFEHDKSMFNLQDESVTRRMFDTFGHNEKMFGLQDAAAQRSQEAGFNFQRGLVGEQAQRSLQSEYRTAAQNTYTSYQADVSKIQTSDLNPEDKQAHIAALNAMYTSRQDFNNYLWSTAQGWSDEWAQLAVEFGGGS